MRWMVILSDIIFFFPMVLIFSAAFFKGKETKLKLWLTWCLVLQPALIIIDHGHFQVLCPSLIKLSFFNKFLRFLQFNGTSLGLTIGAVALILFNCDGLASILFCVALNHKQVSLYSQL